MNLFEYMAHDVRVTDTSGNDYTGCVIVVNGADDFDSDEAEDCLILETKEGKLLDFVKSKIVSIEIID